jgi:UDP:flavonoid glycosyltransferase YjiC (YdhE family)
VLGHAQQRAAVESSGAEFVAYRHARPWSADQPASNVRWAGSLFARRWSRGPVGLLAGLRGLRPTPLWNACDRVLVATDRDLEPATRDPLPPNVCHLGAVQPSPLPHHRDGTPLVLVSLSTIFYAKQGAVLQNILDGLAELDVRVVAATGPCVDPADLRTGPNVQIHRHLDHAEIMPAASLLIGHGGHATMLRALAHGLPLLVLPLDTHLDHRMIGQAVQTAGAGRLLPTSAEPATIRATVRALLSDGSHQRAAATIGARLRANDGAANAVEEIEALLQSRSTPSASPATSMDSG